MTDEKKDPAAWNNRGIFNTWTNGYPTTGGSGDGGQIMLGDVWTTGTVAFKGPLKGLRINSMFRALTDNPGQNVNNWAISEARPTFDAVEQPMTSLEQIQKLGSLMETAPTASKADWKIESNGSSDFAASTDIGGMEGGFKKGEMTVLSSTSPMLTGTITRAKVWQPSPIFRFAIPKDSGSKQSGVLQQMWSAQYGMLTDSEWRDVPYVEIENWNERNKYE